MPDFETPYRIEPTRLEEITEAISDVIAELSAASATLGAALNPHTAANLASLVRMMNTYYSNLIEGHNTRPRDIERALAGEFDQDKERRNLQLEAAAHVRVQTELDKLSAENRLPEPASRDFIRWLHREFYKDAPDEMLRVHGKDREIVMQPGQWRSLAEPTFTWAGTFHLPATELPISWSISNGSIGSSRSRRGGESSPLPPLIIASITSTRSPMETVVSADS
jgi:Fic family protein